MRAKISRRRKLFASFFFAAIPHAVSAQVLEVPLRRLPDVRERLCLSDLPAEWMMASAPAEHHTLELTPITGIKSDEVTRLGSNHFNIDFRNFVPINFSVLITNSSTAEQRALISFGGVNLPQWACCGVLTRHRHDDSGGPATTRPEVGSNASLRSPFSEFPTNELTQFTADWIDNTPATRIGERVEYSIIAKPGTTEIALRVPYTNKADDALYRILAKQGRLKIQEIGHSRDGRILRLLEFTNAINTPEAENVLIYAGEHANEPDANWVATGIAQMLVADEPSMTRLAANINIYLITNFDPDGREKAVYENITQAFSSNAEATEALAYSTWIEAKANAGNPIDIAISLHNPAPGFYEHLSNPQLDYRNFQSGKSLYSALCSSADAGGFSSRTKPWTVGCWPDRFGEYLGNRCGTLVVPLECNGRSPWRQLGTGDLQTVGHIVLSSVLKFASSDEGLALHTTVTAKTQRISAILKLLASNGGITPSERSRFDDVRTADRRYQADQR